MNPGKIIIILIHLASSTLLLTSWAVIAAGQDVEDKKKIYTSELARQAESYFQEALLLSDPKDRELRRLRLIESRRLWIQMREPEKAARACLQMGDSYKQNKEYQESLYYYDLAIEVSPSLDLIKATAFVSLAQIYVDIYRNDIALIHYNNAINHAQAAKDISIQLVALAGLADIYHQQRESARAITCIAQARQLNRQQQDESTEAELLHLTGIIDREKGMVSQARESFEEAIRICRKLGDEEGAVRSLCALSDLYLVSSQKQAALDASKIAVELAGKKAAQTLTNADIIRARDSLWRAWLSQARAQRAVGEKEKAIKSFRWAIHQLEGLYWSFYITTEASAAAFREACQVPYMELADLLVEQGESEQAYICAQQSKARAIMGLIEARHKIDLPKKADQDKALRDIVQAITDLRAQLAFSKLSTEKQKKTQKDIKELEYKMREMRLRSEMKRSRHHLIWSSRPSIKQLQSQMAQEKSTIIEFFLGENRSFVWLTSADNTSLGILPGKREIEKNVNQYLELINTAPNNLYIDRDITKLRERAETLASVLFGDLSEQIDNGQKLIIIPDGVIHYLPFETLIRKRHYLIEDHEISYAPSVSMVVSGRSSKSKIEPEDKMDLLAFGDPIFELVQKTPFRREPVLPPVHITQQGRSTQSFHLDPIPRTRDEVQYIAGLFPSGRQQIYLGKDCTERAVKRETLNRYRRLHFATHSLIDERSPSRSAVVLSLNNDPEEDGFLEVSEIAELDLDSDLVVLSACQTGHGQLLSGEGIVGLSRAFLYAGARAVVVSLWDVSDISTNQLMKSFYQRLVNNASSPVALRGAKLRMIAGDQETRHPYYWASFVVVGKPQV